MRSEVQLPAPIRTAIDRLNPHKQRSTLVDQHSSGEEDDSRSVGEARKLLDISASSGPTTGNQRSLDTDSDVSDGVFDEEKLGHELRKNLRLTKRSHKEIKRNVPKFVINDSLRLPSPSTSPVAGGARSGEDSDSISSSKVILYQSVEDGSIALRAGEEHDHSYQDRSVPRDEYTENEILSGVSFKMKYLGSTPICAVKEQVEDIRGAQAEEAIRSVCGCTNSKSRPSNPVIFTVSAYKILVYDGNMQQLLMDHPIKLVSYVGDRGNNLVVMVKQSPDSTRTTCHVFDCSRSQEVRLAMNRAFTLSYKDVLKRSGQTEESLMQCAYSEVLSSQKRAQDDIADVLDSTKHTIVSIIKRPQEALGLSLISSGPGSIIPTVVVSGLRPASPAYKTEQLNVGNQVLEINGRSLVGLSFEATISYIRSLISSTKVEMQVVPASPVLVIELIRPDLKYPLGFSVKDGHITTLVRGSIGERAGVRVGHRIIAINGESTVTLDHDSVAGILLSETGKLVLKTMQSQIFNHMLGLEDPDYL